MVPTCGAGVTAAAGTSLAHHLFREVFTLTKSLGETEALRIPPSRFRALRSFRDCCTPWGWDQYLSVPLRATTLMALTRHRLGEPLPHQLPDGPPTDREVPKLCGMGGFHTPFHIQYYPQFPEVILGFTVRYRRVTEQFAMLSHRLACLSRILIAATSCRINRD